MFNMAEDTQSQAVDDAPIAPILERRDSLEKQLRYRPEAQDLKNRHILLDTNAAPYVLYVTLCEYSTSDHHSSLQAAQQELERQQASDNLRKQLEKRPEREELVERGVHLRSSC